MGDAPIPERFDTATIVDGYDLAFDAGDARNGSLYLGTPRGGGASPAPWIEALRAAGLWSSEAPKQVADAQRPAYKEGLAFREAVAYRLDDGAHLLLARFDHPKFPSDAERWRAWLALLDARLRRAEASASPR